MPDNNQQQNNPQQQLINLQAQQLAAQVANWAAQLEFQKERMRLLELPEMQGKLQVDIDRLAWEKAQDEWERAIKEATLTGTYNGQPTIEWMTQQAQLTGVLNGQQTIQGKLTDAQIKQMNEQMQLANAQFLTGATGYLNGQKTFDREKFEAGQAQDAWKFLATLTGPANAFKQARAISTMPGGLEGIMGAWAGQYSPAGFGAVGSGGRASLEGLIGGGGPGSPYYYPPAGNFQQPPGPYYQPPGFYPQPGGPPGAGGPAAPTGPAWQPISAPTVPGGSAPGASGALDENSWQYRDIQRRFQAGIITQQQAANEWEGLSGVKAPLYADYSGSNSPAYRDIQARISSGAITPEQGAAEWAAIASQYAAPSTYGPGSLYTPGQPPATAPQGQTPGVEPPGLVPPQQPPTQYDEPGVYAPPESGGVAAPWDKPSDQAPGLTPGGGFPEGAGSSTPMYTLRGGGQQYQLNGYGYGAQNPYSYQGAGVQAPAGQWNYSPTPGGNMNVYPPGVRSDFSTPDISSQYPMSPQQAQNIYQYGGAVRGVDDGPDYTPPPGYQWHGGQLIPSADYNNVQAQTWAPGTGGTNAPAQNPLMTNPWTGTNASLPLPNQINARNYNNSYAYQKELGWAGYEDAGWDKALAQESFEKSLPKYGGPKRGSFAF